MDQLEANKRIQDLLEIINEKLVKPGLNQLPLSTPQAGGDNKRQA